MITIFEQFDKVSFDVILFVALKTCFCRCLAFTLASSFPASDLVTPPTHKTTALSGRLQETQSYESLRVRREASVDLSAATKMIVASQESMESVLKKYVCFTFCILRNNFIAFLPNFQHQSGNGRNYFFNLKEILGKSFRYETKPVCELDETISQRF